MKRSTARRVIALMGICALVCLIAQRAWSQGAAAPKAEPKAAPKAAAKAEPKAAPKADPAAVAKPKPVDRAKDKEKRDRQGFNKRWTFDDDKVGQLPKGWRVAQTGPGTQATWKVLADKLGDLPGGIVALVETKNTGNTFNLLLAEGVVAQDLCLQADIRSTGGQEDPGAGIVWRVQDDNNYYLARWNAKEKNFRVYIMKDGKRKMIADSKVDADPALWHELEIKHNGSHILAELDEADLIDVEDTTFTEAGTVGLYTKSDSTTEFDDIRVAIAKPAQAKPADAAAATPAAATGGAPVQIKFPGGRIAFSSDGNQHDEDDWGATAMSLALVNAAGLNAKFVHYDFSCHLGNNSETKDAQMIKSALGGAERFKLDKSKVFNDQTQLDAAIANFKAEGNKSSAKDPLWYICAGPMEAPWRCVNAVDAEKRPFVHCISHSGWNDKHGDTPEMTHKWEDLGKLGATLHHIADQNNSNGEDDFNAPAAKWAWLQESSNPDWQWLYGRNMKGTFDVSDAGMIFWLITGGPNGGNEKGGSAEAKYLLEHPAK